MVQNSGERKYLQESLLDHSKTLCLFLQEESVRNRSDKCSDLAAQIGKTIQSKLCTHCSGNDRAIILGLAKKNPARMIGNIKSKKVKIDFWTLEEFQKVISLLYKGDYYEHYLFISFWLLFMTGMRIGEAAALQWDDIDFEKETINIQHNVYDKPKDGKGRWYIGTTKTETGTRKIHLSQTLKIALQNYKKKQDYFKKIYGRRYIYYNVEDVKNQSGKVVEHRIVREELSNKDSKKINLIFMRENGLYLGTDITRIPFKIIHNELGIKKCRFYDLRGYQNIK